MDASTEDITFSDDDLPPDSTSGAALNREKFFGSALSMVKLIQFRQTNSHKSLNHMASITDDDEDEPQPKRGHGNKGSVVDELLDTNNINIELLAKNAALEFQILAKQNDELYKEKESFAQKYDDQKQEISALQQQISAMDSYRQQTENLKMENEKYVTQIMVLEEEKDLYHQQIQELQAMNRSQFQNELNFDDINNDNNENNEPFQAQINGKIVSNDDDFLQKETNRLTQEKQQLLLQLDAYKTQATNITNLEAKLKTSELEMQRLSNALTEQQNNYIQLQQSKQSQKDKMSARSSANTGSLIVEYQHKEKAYVETIENQQTMIESLTSQNEELEEQRTSLIRTKSDKKWALKRLKTDVRVLNDGDPLYDESPFGGGPSPRPTGTPLPENDESYENEVSFDQTGRDKEMIGQLQTELKHIKQQMSFYEESELESVQKLLDLSMMGESNNNLLKQQLEEPEYEYEYEEVEVEVTDDEEEEDDVIDIETLNKELEEKENELQIVMMERDEFQNKMNEVLAQNGNLLHHVEEMESMLENAHTEKEELNEQIGNMEMLLSQEVPPKEAASNAAANNASIRNDLETLEQKKQELEDIVHDFKGEYEKLKAKHEHDRKRFEKDERRAIMEKKERENVLEELQQQIVEYEELKKLSEEDEMRPDALSLNMDMVNSLNLTAAQLQQDLSVKAEQLKQEKNAHFETLEKLAKWQQETDVLSGDLKHARKSSADLSYRNTNRIEQLEYDIIELHNEIRDENEKLEKSKGVIMSLRSENRDFEEELMKLNDKMEQEHKEAEEQRRVSIERMNEIVHVLESNEENKHIRESHINIIKRKNDEISQELSDLAQNIAENKRKWNEDAKQYKDNIERLEEEKQEILQLLECGMNAKINTMDATNKEMEELRKAIKSQQIELDQLKNKGMFDDVWSW